METSSFYRMIARMSTFQRQDECQPVKGEEKLKLEKRNPQPETEMEVLQDKYNLLKQHYSHQSNQLDSFSKLNAKWEEQVKDSEVIAGRHQTDSKKYQDYYLMVCKKHDDLQGKLSQARDQLTTAQIENELFRKRIRSDEEETKCYQDKYETEKLKNEKLLQEMANTKEELAQAKKQLSVKATEVGENLVVIRDLHEDNQQKEELIGRLEEQKTEMEKKHATQHAFLVAQENYVSILKCQADLCESALEDNNALQKQLEDVTAQVVDTRRELNEATQIWVEQEVNLREKHAQEKQAMEKRFKTEKSLLIADLTGKQTTIERLTREQDKIMQFLDTVKMDSEFLGKDNIPLVDQLDAFSIHIQTKLTIVKKFCEMVKTTMGSSSSTSAPHWSSNSSSLTPDQPVSNKDDNDTGSQFQNSFSIQTASVIKLEPGTISVRRILSETIQRKRTHGRDGKKIARRLGSSTLECKYYCLCGLKCKSWKACNIHIKYAKQPKNFECPQCFIKYTHWTALKRHLHTFHNYSDSFVCGCRSCGQTFQSRLQYRKHQNVGCAKDTQNSVAQPLPSPTPSLSSFPSPIHILHPIPEEEEEDLIDVETI